MTTARVSDKGQVTLPAEVRKVLGIKSRSKVDVTVRNGEAVIRPLRSVREVSGIFHEAAMQRPADWETVRTETERLVAEQVAREGLE